MSLPLRGSGKILHGVLFSGGFLLWFTSPRPLALNRSTRGNSSTVWPRYPLQPENCGSLFTPLCMFNTDKNFCHRAEMVLVGTADKR